MNNIPHTYGEGGLNPEADARAKIPQSMTRRYWHCMVLVAFLCVAAVFLCALAVFGYGYRTFADQTLTNYAALLQTAYGDYSAAGGSEAGREALARLCPAGVRMTLLDATGTVLYDNEVADVSALENHADRPEVAAALAGGTGADTRQSATLGRETHYYAAPLGSDPPLVLRLALETSDGWGLAAGMLPPFIALAAAVLAVTAALAWALTRRLVAPITHMARHLDTIEADVPYEELIPLAHMVQSDRKLREDNETMRREFTANVSHELKTPLTSISGYAELIETGMAKPEDVQTFGGRIHKEAQRMIALVSDILQLSELDSGAAAEGKAAPEFAPVDLAALVRETAQNMTMNARKAYVTLSYDAQPATVWGSRDLLGELATNLCDNAIRYNRPGGHVELRCATGPDGCPRLTVEDNGIGIPQDSQSRVFERFYRVDKSRSKATGGTGLGLAIVKHIALLHDAKIELTSQIGTGTTVVVVFPKR